MKQQKSKRSRKKKKPKFIGEAGPGSSRRFCLNCKRERQFRYNKRVGHSECTFCGGRVAKRKRREYN